MASRATLIVAFILFAIYLRVVFNTFGSGNVYEEKRSMNLTDEYVWREMTVGEVQLLHKDVHKFLYKVFHQGEQFRSFNVTSFKPELRKASNVLPSEMVVDS